MKNQTLAFQAIFSDIDGTLLTSNHTVSALTRQKLQATVGKGLPFTPVSARSPFCIEPILRDNNLNGCILLQSTWRSTLPIPTKRLLSDACVSSKEFHLNRSLLSEITIMIWKC